MASNSNWTLVDSIPLLSSTIAKLYNVSHPQNLPSLYIDIEGVDLCRSGSISIIQIYCLPLDQSFLLDITTLQSSAFSTSITITVTDAEGQQEQQLVSIKSLLESPTILKAFFDIRNDNDALWNLYRVFVQGVVDLQLMEVAARLGLAPKNHSGGTARFRNRPVFIAGPVRVNGLGRCIRDETSITLAMKNAWQENKDKGIKLFSPRNGGSFEVFNERPLKHEIIEYCVQDVRFLPILFKSYEEKLVGLGKEAEGLWRARIAQETVNRINCALDGRYEPNGMHKTLAPRGWQ